MKIALFTSNGIRHKFFANTLAEHADRILIVTECKPQGDFLKPKKNDIVAQHFYERDCVEQQYFEDHDIFYAPTIPLLYREVNIPLVYKSIKDFNPDAAFVFGSSIIKEPLLSLIPTGRFINMHLGLSPYYRGSGTNFWPFVNEELEYVGATLLHIDAGIDTGDIVAHVRPTFEKYDTVHTAGCKTIKAGVDGLIQCLSRIKEGKELNRVPQWSVENERYYKKADFTEEILRAYLEKINKTLVENHLKKDVENIRLIAF